MPKSQIIYDKPWKDSFREFFDLCGDDWTPPEHLRVVANPKRTRLTVSGVFQKADGADVKLTARVRQYADGSWVQLEERLEMRFEGRLAAGVD
ncbi:MAG: hypothetical protein U1C74_02195 [Phenylobacterium sp.]|nr:hypothetical protein [Phenylobacterium sp.]